MTESFVEPFPRKSLIATARAAKATQGPINPPSTAVNATSPAKGSKQPPKATKENKEPFTSFERIKASCGHEIDFGLYPDKKDRYRKERREKKKKKPCPSCQGVLAQEAIKKQQARQAAIVARQEVKEETFKPKRLPDKSIFLMRYDASTEQWEGLLSIGDSGEARFPELKAATDVLVDLLQEYQKHQGQPDLFLGREKSVIKMCKALDRFFRSAEVRKVEAAK